MIMKLNGRVLGTDLMGKCHDYSDVVQVFYPSTY